MGDRQSRKLLLVRSLRQCLFLYQYWIDAVFGFLSTRLQTGFPFALYVYRNGREWLARQMDQAGGGYQRHDHCFSWIEDFGRAQGLMEEQWKTNWASALDGCAGRAHPLFPELFAHYPVRYYWTSFQTEWAMDIGFRHPEQLRRRYPQLIHLGRVSFSSTDGMRFMDQKVSRQGEALSRNAHQVVSDLKVRQEGVRIKHRLGKNPIKLYDQAYSEKGAVFRSELTLHAPEQFRVFRHKTGQPEGPIEWRTLRAGIADLPRRAEVSQKALDRYCTALASVDHTTTLRELTPSIEKRVRWKGRWVRALHPFHPQDLALLETVHRGEFTIHGLRHRDLRAGLFSTPPPTPQEARRRSAAIRRKLRLLGAHGLIRKLPHTHRYQVTDHGRLILNAVLSAQRTTTQQLTTLAA